MREHRVAVVERGKYVLARPPPGRKGSLVPPPVASFLGGLGGLQQQEELSAVLFSELVPGVHTMELVMPVARTSDGVVAPLLCAAGGQAGLLRQYAAGDTRNLLVFVGHVEKSAKKRIKVTLSLPKTQSANLLLE